jgi:hypothetical protein
MGRRDMTDREDDGGPLIWLLMTLVALGLMLVI